MAALTKVLPGRDSQLQDIIWSEVQIPSHPGIAAWLEYSLEKPILNFP